MDVNVWQLLGNLAVAGAAAWIGSKVGVQHALEKLRNERAFERRIAWYEETVLATTRIRDSWVAYAFATRNDTSQLGALATGMNPAFQAFAEQSNKAVLFAPKGTVQRLDELMKELMQLAVETAKTLERGQLHEEFARQVDALALSLSRFVFELAQELRKELGLEKIELSDVQKSVLEKR
jgi:hypothetical protein